MHRERDVVVGHDAELDVGEPAASRCRPRARRRRACRPCGRRAAPRSRRGTRDRSATRAARRRACGGRPRPGARPRAASTKASALVVPPSSAERVSSRTPPNDMRVHVDRPGKHEAAGRVDHLRAAAVDLADRGDQAVLDQHVRSRASLRDRRRGRRRSRCAERMLTSAGATSANVGAALSSRCVYSWRRVLEHLRHGAGLARASPDPSPARSRRRRRRRRGCG